EIMEKNFFSTPERRERLLIAREIGRLASTEKEPFEKGANQTLRGKLLETIRRIMNLPAAPFRPGSPTRIGQTTCKIVVYATLLIGLGALALVIRSVWSGSGSTGIDARVEKGMAALN